MLARAAEQRERLKPWSPAMTAQVDRQAAEILAAGGRTHPSSD